MWALAAGIVLLATLAGVWSQRSAGLDRWQRDALAMIPRLGSAEDRFDYEDRSGAVLQQWLADAKPACARCVTGQLARPAGTGLQDHQLARPAGVDHLLSIARGGGRPSRGDRRGKLSRPPPSQPLFVQADGWTTASWSTHGRACMLATKASERELRELLASTAQVRLAQGPRI